MGITNYQIKHLVEKNPELVFFKGFKVGHKRPIESGEKHYFQSIDSLSVDGGNSIRNYALAETTAKMLIANAIISALILNNQEKVYGKYLLGGLNLDVRGLAEFEFTPHTYMIDKAIYHNGGEVWFTTGQMHVVLANQE